MFLGTCFRRAFGLLGARFLGVLGDLIAKDGHGKIATAKMKFWTGKEATAGCKNGRGKDEKLDAVKVWAKVG